MTNCLDFKVESFVGVESTIYNLESTCVWELSRILVGGTGRDIPEVSRPVPWNSGVATYIVCTYLVGVVLLPG